MDNENNYKKQLEEAMEEFLMQDVSGDVGYIAPELHKIMAKAALNVLLAAKATNDFAEKNLTHMTPDKK